MANPIVEAAGDVVAFERARPRPPGFSIAITICAFLLLYIPLVMLALYSFIPQGGWQDGWTLDWYRKVFANELVLKSFWMSVWVGVWATLVSTVVGTVAALAIDRCRFPGRGALEALIHVPLIMPEIVLGLALLVWFVLLRITLGSFSIILGHITFSLSYVIITVRARLQGFDWMLEDAAHDLGATPAKAFFRVTLPLIWPGVLSGALMAFTLSFDDFLITFFTAGVGSDTLPLKIYSMIKFGVSPEINALSTLMLVATLALVLVFFRPRAR